VEGVGRKKRERIRCKGIMLGGSSEWANKRDLGGWLSGDGGKKVPYSRGEYLFDKKDKKGGWGIVGGVSDRKKQITHMHRGTSSKKKTTQ